MTMTDATDDTGRLHLVQLGPVELTLVDGDVRYLCLGDVEIVRRIYVAVRDASWGTVPGRLSEVRFKEGAGGFVMTFRCRHAREAIDFGWNGRIEGRIEQAGGQFTAQVRFMMEGRAERALLTNRTGFCVLHPILECAGQECMIEHVDGTTERGRFPLLVSPHQPFTDIGGIRHEPVPGVQAEVKFSGEIFEMEDQRNWTDGSYKTYCRPLRGGFPYQLAEGQVVRQSVTVHVSGRLPQVEELRPGPHSQRATRNAQHLFVGDAIGPMPGIGLRLPDQGVTECDREWLAALNLAHLRLDLDLTGRVSQERLLQTIAAAVAVGLPLEAGLHVPAEPGEVLDRLLDAVAVHLKPRVVRWYIYAAGKPMPPQDIVSRFHRRLGAMMPDAIVGPATAGSFAELNRNRPESAALMGYSVNPQVHASDDLSLMENLQGQGDTVRTARSFAPGAHIAVGPVTLHRRPDPFAEGGDRSDGKAAGQVRPDPRQNTAFAAAWTLVSIKQLAEAGADSLTYYDLCGPFGIADNSASSPVYHVIQATSEMRGGMVRAWRCGAPLTVDALAIENAGRLHVLVANLACRATEAFVEVVRGAPRRIQLASYEVVALDYEPAGKDQWQWLGTRRISSPAAPGSSAAISSGG